MASHIKPWKVADNHERLDPYNGLLLLPNLDKVFDLGFISFNSQGKILISDEVEELSLLGIRPDISIRLDKQHEPYMDYHRCVMFDKK